MMREPWFWRSQSFAARAAAAALSPLSWGYDAAQRMRWCVTQPQSVDIPVICIGNATLGGVGKTPFALLVHHLLKEAGHNAWFMTRGYGGAEDGPIKVMPDNHQAPDVGDEALLLAKHGPVIVSRNRPDGARAALQGSADVIIMDDGFQNPSLKKSLSILLLDAGDPQGTGRIFPAGPLREPLDRAKTRADITVNVWRDRKSAAADTGFHAWLEPVHAPPAQKVIAFTGIGVPAKFFLSLSKAGFEIIRRVSFPDHHRFKEQELAILLRLAEEKKAALITTEKDFVRLPVNFRGNVLTLPVVMRINDPDELKKRLLAAIDAHGRSR